MPIVAITAEGNRDASLAVGCDGFLQKPIDARSFPATVQSFLKGHRESASPERTGKHLRLQSQRMAVHLEEKLQELTRANRRLLELDHARREFYRNISHELSTPMTPIVGYLRLLLNEELGDLEPQQMRVLSAMDGCVQRLRSMIDDLIDVTGLETGRLTYRSAAYDLGALCRGVVEEHQEEAEKRGIILHSSGLDGALPGVGDGGRLAQAIAQLVENAMKFTPQGGCVLLQAGPAGEAEFQICVADTGPGVPAQQMGRIFEPFYQADGSPTRTYGGAGIGLAIVRGIARAHGGDVRVKSPANVEIGGRRLTGAAFHLTFASRVETFPQIEA